MYFLAPTRHLPPNGPVALGNIVSDPRAPEIALNSTVPQAIRGLKVHETTELSQSRSLGQSTIIRPSVWAKFVDATGNVNIGTDFASNFSSGSSSSYAFDKIVTQEIFPDLEAVRAIFSDQQVQDSIKNSRWQSSAFMIVGLQIAYGAEVVVTADRERGIQLQTGVDLTPASIPISVGAGLDFSKTPSESLSTRYADPFIFAYRLRQIMYRRKKVTEQKLYDKGDLFGDKEDVLIRKEEEEEEVFEAQLGGLEDEDEELPGMFDLRTEEAGEDGENILVAYPHLGDDDSDE